MSESELKQALFDLSRQQGLILGRLDESAVATDRRLGSLELELRTVRLACQEIGIEVAGMAVVCKTREQHCARAMEELSARTGSLESRTKKHSEEVHSLVATAAELEEKAANLEEVTGRHDVEELQREAERRGRQVATRQMLKRAWRVLRVVLAVAVSLGIGGGVCKTISDALGTQQPALAAPATDARTEDGPWTRSLAGQQSTGARSPSSQRP